MGLWKLSLSTCLIKYEIVQYLLCISRNPAVEEERLVVSEQIFLENLRDDQPLLQMAGLAVQVVGGEAGEVLGVVRHSGDATQNSLHQTLLCLGKIYRKILSLTVCRAVDWPGRSATPSWSAGSSSVTITGSWGTRTLVLVSKRQERRRWCRQYNCQTIVLHILTRWDRDTGRTKRNRSSSQKRIVLVFQSLLSRIAILPIGNIPPSASSRSSSISSSNDSAEGVSVFSTRIFTKIQTV